MDGAGAACVVVVLVVVLVTVLVGVVAVAWVVVTWVVVSRVSRPAWKHAWRGWSRCLPRVSWSELAALAEPLSAGVVEVAWADFCSIWWAFCWDVVTAPWALAIALVRPSTPGAEPW